MLIEFSVANYFSIKERVTISLKASNYDKFRDSENVISCEKFGISLLKSAVIFGPNSSGKTKLLEAFEFFKGFIHNSFESSQMLESINVTPFRFNSESEKQPSFFEIIFIHENLLFRYGFEVSKFKVHSEWLFYKVNTKEIELINRKGQEFKIHKQLKASLELVEFEDVNEDVLLVSMALEYDLIPNTMWNGLSKLELISGLEEDSINGFTVMEIQENMRKDEILKFLKIADPLIEDLTIQVLDLDNLPNNTPDHLRNELLNSDEPHKIYMDILIHYKKFNNEKIQIGSVPLSLRNEVSEGIKKFFAISGPIIHTLREGRILLIDELDAKLHPLLLIYIINLFNSKTNNPNNAQLIINTHGSFILSSGLFRRDQIWFTEKNEFGEVKLFSLKDLKSGDLKIRKDEDYAKNYLNGKYGAIPKTGFFE